MNECFICTVKHLIVNTPTVNSEHFLQSQVIYFIQKTPVVSEHSNVPHHAHLI